MATKLDFMASDEFRQVLEADLKEMRTCFESNAWKATHVLAGSIVEAVLVDYIIAAGYTGSGKAGRANLASIVQTLRDNNAISETLSDLCSAIKDYRNLVHPGRLNRTKGSVDANSAGVAVGLVEMILKEVRARRQAQYGYTADQLLSKIRSDPSVKPIIIHLLEDVKDAEKEMLLIKVLPEAYMRSIELREPGSDLLHLASVFRTILDSVGNEIQKKVVERFVKILKESSGSYISTYELAFFRMSDTRHLSNADAQLVKDHFAAQLQFRVPSPKLVECLSGMGKIISKDEFHQFIAPLIRYANFAPESGSGDLRNAVRRRLSSEYYSSGAEFQENLMAEIDGLITFYKETDQSERAEELNSLKIDIEIPF